MRIKRNRKLMSILLALSLLVTLLVPMVGPASAASTYTMSNVQTVAPTALSTTVPVTLGQLQIDFPSMTTSSYAYMSLPADPTGYSFTNLAAYYPTDVNGTANGITSGSITATGRVIKISVTGTPGAAGRIVLGSSVNHAGTIYGGAVDDLTGMKVDIPTGVSGEVDATISASSGSLFTGGTVAIAKVGNGSVYVTAENVPSIGSQGGPVGVIDIKEGNAGSLVNSSDSLKLTLPPGFTWRTASVSLNTVFWGSPAADIKEYDYGTNYNSGRDLILNMNNAGSGDFFALNAQIDVDESVAKMGDVVVQIAGDSSSTASTLTIGSYGQYGLTAITNGDPTSLVAGKQAVKLGKFEIDENLAGSLIPGRTITLTLPTGVVWNQGPNLDTGVSTQQTVSGISSSDWQHVGTDGRTIKVAVNTSGGTVTTSAAKLIFKDAEVTPAVDFSGDVAVTFGGTQGLTNTLTLAKVTPGITASVASTPDVKIGMSGQAVGDVTIVESAAGNIDGTPYYSALNQTDGDTNIYLAETANGSGSADLVLKAPAGVTFTNVPTVTVTSGDLQINTTDITTGTTTQNEGTLTIPVKSTSTVASTIKISGIQITIDRTVPEGTINLKVQGPAVDETTLPVATTGSIKAGEDVTLFPNDDTAAKLAVANVVTPAPGETKATAVFTIGSTDFTLNGVKTTMDAAPYLKNDRTYLPIRFVAQAVGVTDSNIIWNGDDQSVTLIKGGTVVKLVVGSTTMTINGTPITMDVAPEIVDPGRVMLPVRWVGQALGCTINWDAATQTVTVN